MLQKIFTSKIVMGEFSVFIRDSNYLKSEMGDKELHLNVKEMVGVQMFQISVKSACIQVNVDSFLEVVVKPDEQNLNLLLHCGTIFEI